MTDRNNKPLFTVIVTSYNIEKYLERCLKSIESQTYENFEALIIDGGSIDASTDTAEHFAGNDERFTLLRIPSDNSGEARNHGLSRAGGEYIVFIDGDDFVDPCMLEKLSEIILQDSPDLICYPCCQHNTYTGVTSEKAYYFRRKSMEDDLEKQLFEISHYYAFTKCIRTDFIRKEQLRFGSSLYYDEPVFYCLAMYRAGRISLLDEPLYYHRIRNDRKQFKYKSADALLSAVETVHRYLTEDHSSEEIMNSFINVSVDWLYDALTSIHQPEARYRILEAVMSDRFKFINQQAERETGGLNEKRKQKLQVIEQAYEQMMTVTAQQQYTVQETESVNVGGIKRPKLSVIMPVYNSAEYLSETVESVLNQSFADFEFICVDDGSSDRSMEILKNYAAADRRLAVIGIPHAGVSIARNVGIRHARGEYVYFIDSDDLLISEKVFERIVPFAEANDLDALYFNAEPFYDEACTEQELLFRPEYRRTNQYPISTDGQTLFCDFVQNKEYIVTIWMALFRRKLMTDHDILFYPHIIHSDNLFTYQMILSAEKAGYIDDVLYRRRIHPNSIMTTKQDFLSSYSYFICGNEMKTFLDRIDPVPDGNTAFCAYETISDMYGRARRDFKNGSFGEKGRRFGLNQDYVLYQNLISGPAMSELRKNELEKTAAGQKKTIDQEKKARQKSEADIRKLNRKLKNITDSRLYRYMAKIRRVKNAVTGH